METISKLINLPVLSLYEGEMIGNVKEIYFDKKLKKLEYLSIENDEGLILVIQSKNIYNVGKNALTIKNNNQATLMSNLEPFDEYFAPLNVKIFSMHGELLGIAKDFEINEKYEVKSIITEEKTIDTNMQINCSKNAIILYDQDTVKINSFKTKALNIFKTKKDDKVIIQPIENENVINISNINNENQVKIVSNTDFLLNRRTTADIFGLNDEIIIKNNTLITKKTVATATRFGKLKELMIKSR